MFCFMQVILTNLNHEEDKLGFPSKLSQHCSKILKKLEAKSATYDAEQT